MRTVTLSALLVVLLGLATRPKPVPRRPEPASTRGDLDFQENISAAAGPKRRTFPVTRRGALTYRPRNRRSGITDELAAWCDALARAIRGGSTLSSALRTAEAPEVARPTIDRVLLSIDRGRPLREALADEGRPGVLDVPLTVLRVCAANGGSPAEPIDRAAATLRARAADEAERLTQSAQARMSALVMTLLPIAMLGILVASSSSVRASTLSPMGGSVVLVGIALNLIGWRWMRRLTTSTMLPRGRARASRRRALAALPDFVDVVIVGVRAGLSPAAAVRDATPRADPALRPTLDDVTLRLRRGQRLADALSAFPDHLGPDAAGFADALAAADRYGLPIEPVLDRLAADARTDRRRHSERYARTLPVRLAFPLVACTLPSFVLLAIVPAVLGTVSTLGASAP